MGTESEVHPSWCVAHFCTSNRGRSGAHRSQPIIVVDAPVRVTTALYAEAGLPDHVLVEVTRNGVSLALLPVAVAHSLGRVLASLGTAVEGFGPTVSERPAAS